MVADVRRRLNGYLIGARVFAIDGEWGDGEEGEERRRGENGTGYPRAALTSARNCLVVS